MTSRTAKRKESGVKTDDWQQPIQRHKPLEGQLELFGDERVEVKPQVDEPLIDDLGRRFLSDYGHGLPGAAETDQMLIWDV